MGYMNINTSDKEIILDSPSDIIMLEYSSKDSNGEPGTWREEVRIGDMLKALDMPEMDD